MYAFELVYIRVEWGTGGSAGETRQNSSYAVVVGDKGKSNTKLENSMRKCGWRKSTEETGKSTKLSLDQQQRIEERRASALLLLEKITTNFNRSFWLFLHPLTVLIAT